MTPVNQIQSDFHNYLIKLTADGSPTLQTQDKNQESMHHSGGAYSETQLIYGQMIAECLRRGGRRFLITGLGLGYIEWTLIDQVFKAAVDPSQVFLVSVENDPILVNSQRNFISGNLDSVTLKTASQFFTDFLEIQKILERKLMDGSWQIVTDLNQFSESASKTLAGFSEQRFQGICYDFYSSKQDPHLWSEDFLKSFLAQFADPNGCYFSTYACTGALKRALLQQNFTVIKKPGFCQKRDSTLAYNYKNSL
jgi:hypothetical protein